MGKKYSKEQYQVDFDHYIADNGLADYYYGEIAAKEDAICDNEDADTTDIKICMSQVRKHQVENNLDKEECKEVNGEWKNGGCNFYEDEQNHEQQVIEDYGNTVSDIDDEFQKQQEYFETRAESSNNSNPEKIAEQILAEEENEQKEITPEEALTK